MKSTRFIFCGFTVLVALFAANFVRADDQTETVQIGRAMVTRNLAPAQQPVAQPEHTVAERTRIPAISEETVAARTVIPVATSPIPTAQPAATQSTAVARAAMQSTSAARVAAAQSQGVATRARAGENVREIGAATDMNTRNEALNKGIANQSAAVRRAGVASRPSTAEVGGRATVGDTNLMTGNHADFDRTRAAVNARATTTRPTVTADTLATWQATSAINATCIVQYTDCMDQFCNVLDANQKRCSCSSRLNNYNQMEKTVKSANEQLNEVAQRIRYVGLSADEIRAIMSATEAELALAGAKDKTESRKMLEQIEKLIKDPNAFAAENTSFGILDLDMDFANNVEFSEIFDLTFGGGSSFAHLRGTQLFTAAKNKCARVLDACKRNGADVSQITGRYELDIDKDCIGYEQGLNKMNQTVRTNVRAATTMLQKARLAVLQDQNLYDTRGCLGALETCMTDDMVCGPDYYKCLDPTKKYIDENGLVVLGQNVTTIELFMVNYSNADPDLTKALTLVGFPNCTLMNNDGTCIIKYLLDKIGTGDTNTGLCRPVLDKCRQVTYTANKQKYNPSNEVIRNYIQRTMVNIGAAQKRIITDYAASCMAEIATCYAQQVSQINAWSSNANLDTVYRVMKGACRNVALTCSYAVFQKDHAMCPIDPLPPAPNSIVNEDKCIERISDIFYNSLLCPLNSVYVVAGQTVYQSYDSSQRLSERCFCATGYKAQSGMCVKP